MAAVEVEEERALPAYNGLLILTVLLAICSVGLLVYGFFGDPVQSAIQEAAVFAGAATFGILARLAQATRHHMQLTDRLDLMR
jgi:hypothetical protein